MATLRGTTVRELVAGKGKLVEVPYNASVGDTLNTMLAHDIVAVVVAAPPRHWIGAGGSMILESDRATGSARKHYIGIVSVLDVLIHLAEDGDTVDVSSLLANHVSTIIGHCLEGLTLWAFAPQTSVLDAMEAISRGVHRALVPLESQREDRSGLEWEEASPGYHMLTQSDVVRFLSAQAELRPIFSQSLEALGAVHPHIFGVPANMTLIDTMKCMMQAGLAAVAVLDAVPEGGQVELISAKGSRIIGTFSASDLRGCSAEVFECWAKEGVLRFVKRANEARKVLSTMGSLIRSQGGECGGEVQLPLLTCHPSSLLGEVVSKALEWRVHRVWVVEQQDMLVGVVSFSDVLRVVRDQHIARSSCN